MALREPHFSSSSDDRLWVRAAQYPLFRILIAGTQSIVAVAWCTLMAVVLLRRADWFRYSKRA